MFFLFFSLIYQACSSLPEQINLARQDQNPTPTPLPEKTEDSNESYLAADENIVNRTGEIQMVFMGYLDFKNGKIVSGNNWSVGEDKANIKLKPGMRFDVLTCAGFAVQAKLKKYHGEKNASDQGYDWEMEFISDKTFEADVNTHLKCRGKDGNYIRAFAVYPSQSNRRKIKVKSEPDVEKVFASLSVKDKKWIASDDPENTDYTERTKNEPDIEAWTDANGDGEIDLIEVAGNCNGKSDGDLTCFQILHWSNKMWSRVGWLATD